MHPVEDAKRLAEVHQDKPGGETEELLPEAILKLRVDSERRDDPQLRQEGTRVSAEVAEERCVLLNTHYVTMTLQRMRKVQISLIAAFVQGLFPSCFWATGAVLAFRREVSVFLSSPPPSPVLFFGCCKENKFIHHLSD